MNLRAQHTTTYLYNEPVSICHTEVHLMPRTDRNQRVLEHQLSILPMPEQTFPHRDYFGNDVTYFSIHEPHRTLTITAASVIRPGKRRGVRIGATTSRARCANTNTSSHRRASCWDRNSRPMPRRRFPRSAPCSMPRWIYATVCTRTSNTTRAPPRCLHR
jgi:transglutaminase-like putative cysteine protease